MHEETRRGFNEQKWEKGSTGELAGKDRLRLNSSKCRTIALIVPRDKERNLRDDVVGRVFAALKLRGMCWSGFESGRGHTVCFVLEASHLMDAQRQYRT